MTVKKVSEKYRHQGFYICNTRTEVQNAENAIGAGAGIIKLVGDMTWSTVTFNGGGSYIVEGDGCLLTSNDTNVFNVTNATSITFRNFNIDVTAFTTSRTIFRITACGRTLIDNIKVTGDGINGVGVSSDSAGSDFITVQNCEFNTIYRAIYYYESDQNMVLKNKINTPYYHAIHIRVSFRNIVANNIINCSDVSDLIGGIELRGSHYTVVNGNIMYDANLNRTSGMRLNRCYQLAVNGNVCYDIHSTTGSANYGMYSFNSGLRVAFTGNVVYDIQNDAGSATGIYCDGGDTLIVGNLALNCKTAGVAGATLMADNNV